MKTSEVLRKAGDILRSGGWCQGDYRNGAQHCAEGAIKDSTDDPFDAEEILDGLLVLPKDRDCDSGATLRWNDAPGRTAAEVRIMLDAAYVVALQEEGLEPEDVL